MKFGKDFFRTLNVVIQMLRMLAKMFGDDEDKKAALESEAKSKDGTSDNAC